MTRGLLARRGRDTAMKETNAWAKFTTAELKTKLAALRELTDCGALTDRSVVHQFSEIIFIEHELARPDGA